MSHLLRILVIISSMVVRCKLDGNLVNLNPSNFPFLALFLTKDDYEPISSGTVIGRKFILTTRIPITTYAVSDLIVLSRHTIKINNISQIYQYELEEMIYRAGNDVVVAKLTENIMFDIELSIAFIDAIVFKKKEYQCELIIWAPETYEDTPLHESLSQDIQRKKITGFKYRDLENMGCKTSLGLSGCMRSKEVITIYDINRGAPLMCGLGAIGIYASPLSSANMSSTRNAFEFTKFSEIVKLKETIREELREGRAKPCDPSGVGEMKSALAVVFLAVIFNEIV